MASCQFDPSGPSTNITTDGASTDVAQGSSDGAGQVADGPPGVADGAVSVDVATECDPSYTIVSGTSRYRVGPAPTNWYAAEQDCESDGGHLAVIDDVSENTFVRGLVTGDIWIGMSDHRTEQTYRWVTGALVDSGYMNWKLGQPNDIGGAEDCGEMDVDPGGPWVDEDCPFDQEWVCECDFVPLATPLTWCETGTDTDCDVCGDDCTGGLQTCGAGQSCS